MNPIKIVVLQRGWVVVGRVAQEGTTVTITSARIIRRWGTTRGLGELVNGPLPTTVLDPAGNIAVHELAVVFAMDVVDAAWNL